MGKKREREKKEEKNQKKEIKISDKITSICVIDRVEGYNCAWLSDFYTKLCTLSHIISSTHFFNLT